MEIIGCEAVVHKAGSLGGRGDQGRWDDFQETAGPVKPSTRVTFRFVLFRLDELQSRRERLQDLSEGQEGWVVEQSNEAGKERVG
jgi:hypothetical protein